MAMTEEVKKERKEARKLARKREAELAIVEEHKAQNPVKSMTINIEWKKSRMWGSNPSAEARIEHYDGTFSHIGPFTCSGCGYDKESTVIADIFNVALRYELYRRIKKEQPYGVYYYGGKYEDKGEYFCNPTYNGGVGTSCYYRIAEFIGGRFENVSNGKTFDVFKYIDKKRRKKEVLK